MNVEYITVPLQVKALEAGQFEGYASTFGNVDLGGDVVVKGAFQESIHKARSTGEWPQMFWMHKPDQIPGKWHDMMEDTKGLKVKGETLPTTIGKDVKILMDARAVRALSIGFSLDDEEDFEFRDGVRLLKRINLWEVSPVSIPMNPKAKISAVKALLHQRGESLTDLKRDLEQWFRSKGLSKSQSLAFASKALADDSIPDFDFGATPKPESSVATTENSRSDSADDEKVAQAIRDLADTMLADVIKRKIAA